MSETPGDASLDDFLREQIPRLAVLYDRFAFALDPFDQARDIAEPKPSFRDFRRHVIKFCLRRLHAGDKPTSI